jgi:glyoxylase-like metal-dependent hydrolase (beta-lactamase superfamily II)
MSESKYLPLPQSVLPLPEGPEGYRLQRAGERGYVVISGFVQAAFVVTDEGVILVDAPPALDGKIQAAIASVTYKQVTHFIYTHSHLDHVGAVTKSPAPGGSRMRRPRGCWPTTTTRPARCLTRSSTGRTLC